MVQCPAATTLRFLISFNEGPVLPLDTRPTNPAASPPRNLGHLTSSSRPERVCSLTPRPLPGCVCAPGHQQPRFSGQMSPVTSSGDLPEPQVAPPPHEPTDTSSAPAQAAVCGSARAAVTRPWGWGGEGTVPTPVLWVRPVPGEVWARTQAAPGSQAQPDHGSGSCDWWAWPPLAPLGTPSLPVCCPPSCWDVDPRDTRWLRAEG